MDTLGGRLMRGEDRGEGGLYRGGVCGGRPGQRMEEQGTWASRTRKRSEAGCGRPEDGGVWTAKTVKRPPQQPAQPQYANYWAPLTRKRHILPHPAQPQHTNHWDPRTRKRHQQEHRPQRPTESSDPTQHAKGRTGDCPGSRKETTSRRNVTRGVIWGRISAPQILSVIFVRNWFGVHKDLHRSRLAVLLLTSHLCHAKGFG